MVETSAKADSDDESFLLMHHRMCHSTSTTTTPPTNTAINHSSDILTFYQRRVGIMARHIP